MHSLDGCRAKIDRAVENLNSLNAEGVQYLESKPYLVRCDYHADPDRFVFCVERIEPAHPRLGVLVGDLVHNARSCLDHLIWQLVIAAGRKPGRWNTFPIYSDRDDFLCNVTLPARRRGRGPLGGLDPEGGQWALIERAQPFNSQTAPGTTGKTLEAVASLNNEDKHRVILRALSAIKKPTAEWSGKFSPDQDVAAITKIDIHWGPPLKPDGRFATLYIRPSGPSPKVNMHGGLPVEIAVGKIAFRIVEFRGLLGDVWRLVASFEPFFPVEGWPFDPPLDAATH